MKTALDNATAEDSGGGTSIAVPVSIENGGTGASNASDARANLGITLENIGAAAETDLANYLPLTGGTLTGKLVIMVINNQENVLGRLLLSATEFQISLLNKSDSTQINAMALTEEQSYFRVPVSIISGGTGANTAEQARENLGIVDPTPVYVETEETSEPGLHIIVDSENNVLKVKKV